MCQIKSKLLQITAIVFGALTVTSLFAGEVGGLRADSLLSVDQNRTEIVEGLVAKWKDHLASGKESDLKKTLMSLRADRLLAVSLAQDQKQFAALLEKDDFLPMKHESPAQAGAQGEVAHVKALGDPNTDVVYVPVTPCRLFYTEIASGGVGGALLPGVTRTFDTRGSLTGQGGAAGCSVPATATAIVLQMGAFSSFGLGWINAGPQGPPIPAGVLMAYNNVAFINATSVVLKLNSANGQFWAFSNNNRTELYGDVLGYFAPPTTAGNGLRVVQTTAFDAPNIINGSANNSASGSGATVAGGGGAGNTCFDPPTGQFIRPCGNRALNDLATVGGGYANVASGPSSTVGGGSANTASGGSSTVPGGSTNTASGDYSTIAGGFRNTASGEKSIAAGGDTNIASGTASIVAGGRFNKAIGAASTVAGGESNSVSGAYSFVAGRNGGARAQGMFVWSDSRGLTFDPVEQGFFGASLGNPAPADNTFIVRATGGVQFTSGINASTGQVTTQCFISPSGTGWTCVSDRALKEAIQVVQPKSVLARLMQMPVSTWSIKGEKRRQMGPMAQDFHQAFGLGDTDKAINSIDAQGVAFAAIQGLNQKLVEESKAKDAKINAQANELAALKRKLEAIEKKLGL